MSIEEREIVVTAVTERIGEEIIIEGFVPLVDSDDGEKEFARIVVRAWARAYKPLPDSEESWYEHFKARLDPDKVQPAGVNIRARRLEEARKLLVEHGRRE